MIALFAGSFHPLTNGHMDIIERSARIFDKVYVAIMYNSEKTYTISIEDRIQMLKKATCEFQNVEIVSDTGLTSDLARNLHCDVLVRGIRNTQDFEYEAQIANANREIFGIETMFLCCEPRNAWISSTIVNDIIRHGGDISKMVPESITEDILRASARTSKGV